jgi:hypothetical protein
MWHVDIRALEIHPEEHPVALARHLRAEHPRRARGRHDKAQNHRNGGGLAGAIAAKEPGDRAGLELKRNAVDRTRGLVDLDEIVDGNGGFSGGHEPQM